MSGYLISGLTKQNPTVDDIVKSRAPLPVKFEVCKYLSNRAAYVNDVLYISEAMYKLMQDCLDDPDAMEKLCKQIPVSNVGRIDPLGLPEPTIIFEPMHNPIEPIDPPA